MQVKIESSWSELLQKEFEQPYFSELANFVKEEYKKYRIFPAGRLIFNAFDLCPVEKVKVILLGQDPYHGLDQAHGLCFSVREGMPMPPSLFNIFKELNRDLGSPMPPHGNLTKWAIQGVLLLNSTLTVREGQPGSHQNKGWELFTDEVIKKISSYKGKLVFMLWGNYAISKKALINQTEHLVLTSVHPSPLSAHRGFIGNGHFSKCNEFLKSNGSKEIDW